MCCRNGLSRPTQEETVGFRSRRVSSDSALTRVRLPTGGELRDEWIYLHSCLSAWLQQWSAGDLHHQMFLICKVDWWLGATSWTNVIESRQRTRTRTSVSAKCSVKFTCSNEHKWSCSQRCISMCLKWLSHRSPRRRHLISLSPSATL